MVNKDKINSKIPLLLHEVEHSWHKTKLYGCEACGSHDGLECDNCHRVIDQFADSLLYEAVLDVGFIKEETDEDHS